MARGKTGVSNLVPVGDAFLQLDEDVIQFKRAILAGRPNVAVKYAERVRRSLESLTVGGSRGVCEEKQC